MSPQSNEIHTDRLVIQEWRQAVPDETAMVDLLPSVLTAATTESLPDAWRGSYTRERARAWLRDIDRDAAVLLAIDSASAKIVGLIFLFESTDFPHSRTIRIGYVIAEQCWGRGYASEMLAGLIGSYQGSGPCTLLAGVARTNLASRRVLEKNDFVQLPQNEDAEELTYRRVVGSATDTERLESG